MNSYDLYKSSETPNKFLPLQNYLGSYLAMSATFSGVDSLVT